VISQVRFYSDDAAMTFVRREFPEYFEAYLHLPKDVERADFFR
jgi:mannosyltransferase OCH1-like enzyme